MSRNGTHDGCAEHVDQDDRPLILLRLLGQRCPRAAGAGVSPPADQAAGLRRGPSRSAERRRTRSTGRPNRAVIDEFEMMLGFLKTPCSAPALPSPPKLQIARGRGEHVGQVGGASPEQEVLSARADPLADLERMPAQHARPDARSAEQPRIDRHPAQPSSRERGRPELLGVLQRRPQAGGHQGARPRADRPSDSLSTDWPGRRSSAPWRPPTGSAGRAVRPRSAASKILRSLDKAQRDPMLAGRSRPRTRSSPGQLAESLYKFEDLLDDRGPRHPEDPGAGRIGDARHRSVQSRRRDPRRRSSRTSPAAPSSRCTEELQLQTHVPASKVHAGPHRHRPDHGQASREEDA